MFFFTVQILVKNGLSVNKRDKEGLTPLHIACANGYHHIAMTLLEAHATVKIQTNSGMSPLHFASMSGSIGK